MVDGLRLYAHLAAARIRADWQYRATFWSLTFAQTVAVAADLIVLWALFRRVNLLAGWRAEQVLLLYGLSSLSFGFADLIVSPVEAVADLVRLGGFDRFLLRPGSPLVQLAGESFALRRIGRVFTAALALAVAIARGALVGGPATVVLLVLTMAGGTVVWSALWVLGGSLSLVVVGVREVANAFTYGGNLLTQYPVSLFAGWLRRFVLWVLPLGFVAYVPGLRLTGAPNPLGLPAALQWAAPLSGVPLALAARAAWVGGLRRHTSTGS